jgi:protein-tyrosine phosphatase
MAPRPGRGCDDGLVTYRVCFVCTGNICRSPMAEVLLEHEAAARGLSGRLTVDSAGIAAEVGFDIDRRARQALERSGFVPHRHLARQFEPGWLNERDLVIAMDSGHLRWLERRAPARGQNAVIRLLLSYLEPGERPRGSIEISDPYFGDDRDFASCLELIRAGCAALLDEIEGGLAE